MGQVKKIIVTIEGGVVQFIAHIPSGVIVEVHDYDTDGVEEEKLRTDKDGNKHTVVVWP